MQTLLKDRLGFLVYGLSIDLILTIIFLIPVKFTLQDTQFNESQVTQVLFSAPASTATCSNIGVQSILENVEGDSVFGSLPKPASVVGESSAC